MKAKFYRCSVCGNVIIKLVDSGVTPICCSKEMEVLKVNTVDHAGEKHLPVAKMCFNGKMTVHVGEEAHPMTTEHWIQFIAVETEKGIQVRYLDPGDRAKAIFRIPMDDSPVAIYAYCNVHGLWRSKFL